jgi:hypothetical protein
MTTLSSNDNDDDFRDDDAPSGSTIAWLFWVILSLFSLLMLISSCGCAMVRVQVPPVDVSANVGRDSVVMIAVKGTSVTVNTISKANPEIVKAVAEGIAKGAVEGLK